MQMDLSRGDELGALSLALAPAAPCVFPASPARSLRVALLRRLEIVDPELSQALHEDAGPGARDSDHPWTVSPLLGPLTRDARGLTAEPGAVFRVRVTALAPRVLSGLAAAFDPDQPLGREPLHLERVPFHVDHAASRLEGRTYASLLNEATPQRVLTLSFLSPTAFRRSADASVAPEPRRCIEGYLRKWNAFGNMALSEEGLLNYVEDQVRVAASELRPATMRLGRYSQAGMRGWVRWEADGGQPALLRAVNALADYAGFCGTGMKTAQGMGQTRRIATRV